MVVAASSEGNGEQLKGTWGDKKVSVKGVVAFLSVIIVVLLGGFLSLVKFSLNDWGHPVDLGQKLDTLADGHEVNSYILAVCLSRDSNMVEECNRVAVHLSRPDSLNEKMGTQFYRQR